MSQISTYPKGLTYIEEFISADLENELIKNIDIQDWRSDLKRRVQHYGYRYDYKARNVSESDYLGELPSWLNELANRLVENSIFSERPDQVIINEYEPGQGIAPHVDCVPCFENTIVSLSLLSACEMNFKDIKQNETPINLYLNRRSLLILKDEARFNWTHAIAPRKSDVVKNIRKPRSRRISLTFRKVII